MNDTQLTTDAAVIRDETADAANTADRIGDMLVNIIADKINKDKIDTDITMAANSDTLVASQKAAKAYTDAAVAGVSAGYKAFAAYITNAAGTYSVTVKQNDFGATTFPFTAGATGEITVTASAAVFTVNKTASLGSSIFSNAGVPQFLLGIATSTTVFTFSIWKYDGTKPSVPNFTDQLFEIRVYN